MFKISKLLNFIFIVAVSCFLSCSRGSSDVVRTISPSDLGEIITLYPTDYTTLSDQITFAARVYVSELHLVTVEPFSQDQMVSIYDINTFDKLTVFGKQGNGPNEFLDFPSSLQPQLMDEGILELFDWSKKRLIGVDIETLIQSNETKYIYEHHLSPALIDAQIAGLIDGKLIAVGTLSEGLAAIMDLGSGQIQYHPFYPEPKTDSKPMDIKWYFTSELAIHPNKEKFALAMYRFNQLIISDTNRTVQRVTRFNAFEPDFNPQRNTPYYYTSLNVTNKHIYASWYGKSEYTFREESEKGMKPQSEIHVFDWSGNPVRRFSLGNSYVTHFAVDVANKRIISIDEYNEESPLLFYYTELIE